MFPPILALLAVFTISCQKHVASWLYFVCFSSIQSSTKIMACCSNRPEILISICCSFPYCPIHFPYNLFLNHCLLLCSKSFFHLLTFKILKTINYCFIFIVCWFINVKFFKTWNIFQSLLLHARLPQSMPYTVLLSNNWAHLPLIKRFVPSVVQDLRPKCY